jgi:hypothetical protein
MGDGVSLNQDGISNGGAPRRPFSTDGEDNPDGAGCENPQKSVLGVGRVAVPFGCERLLVRSSSAENPGMGLHIWMLGEVDRGPNRPGETGSRAT